MKLTAVAQAISATATRLGIALSAQAQSTVAAVSVEAIHLAYEIGQYITRLHKADAVSVVDGAGVLSEMFVSFFKSKLDNFSVAEEIALDFHKSLRDTAGLTDDQIMAFFKSLQDTASATDHYAISFGKPAADQFGAMEHAVRSFYKALTDTAGFSDHEVRAFGKALVDQSSLSDHYVAAFDKPLTDGAGFVDTQTRAMTKLILDQITVTDDFDGAASVNDDQTMQFSKAVVDMAGFTDLFDRVVAYVRQFEDTATFTDDLALDSTKLLSDVPIMSELISKGLAKAPINDQFAVTDYPSLGAGLVKQDSTLLSDTGSLRSQGYCEFSYFAEDYVGASRTF